MNYKVGEKGWLKKKSVEWTPGPDRVLLTDTQVFLMPLIDQAVQEGRPVWVFGCAAEQTYGRHPVFAGNMVSTHHFGGDPSSFHRVDPLEGMMSEQVRRWLELTVEPSFFDDDQENENILPDTPKNRATVSGFLDELVAVFNDEILHGEHRGGIKHLALAAGSVRLPGSCRDASKHGADTEAAALQNMLKDRLSCGFWPAFEDDENRVDLGLVHDFGGHCMVTVPHGLGRNPVNLQMASYLMAALCIHATTNPKQQGPLIITVGPGGVVANESLASALTNIPNASVVHCVGSSLCLAKENLKQLLGSDTSISMAGNINSAWAFCEDGGQAMALDHPDFYENLLGGIPEASKDLPLRCRAQRLSQELTKNSHHISAAPARIGPRF